MEATKEMRASDRPDLAVGMAIAAIAPGEMVEGSYDGRRVLLARVADAFYAVGGECTHHGAPLCEGVLRGRTVLCPWHHARFDLASGRVVAPPALSGLRRYRVAEKTRRRDAGSRAGFDHEIRLAEIPLNSIRGMDYPHSVSADRQRPDRNIQTPVREHGGACLIRI